MITINNRQKKIIINLKNLHSGIQRILNHLHYNSWDIGILITTNATIKKYNQTYRHKAQPTDILAFPFHRIKKPGNPILSIHNDDKNLGDLIISAEYIYAHTETPSGFDDHLSKTIIHGICHLLGYDHIKNSDYRIMRIQERALLRIFNDESTKHPPNHL